MTPPPGTSLNELTSIFALFFVGDFFFFTTDVMNGKLTDGASFGLNSCIYKMGTVYMSLAINRQGFYTYLYKDDEMYKDLSLW